MLALQDAGLTIADIAGLDPIVVTGTSIMDVEKVGQGIETVIKRGTRYSQAASIIYETSTVNIAAKIAQRLQVPTRMSTVQTSCCSGMDAIGQAAEMVANGQSNLALAGGSECPLVYYPMLGFNASDLSPTSAEMPEKACRPFDLWRTTGVLGEGACIFVLEPADSPRKPLAWIAGHGFANDTDSQTGSGLRGAIQAALANACRRPEEIGYINAWGPGHRTIDQAEAAALAHVFGDRLSEIPVTSIKGAIGTALGASGPIQLASTILSLAHGLLPPTVNWENPDPTCPLNLSNQKRHLPVKVALVNSHGLAGSNAALVIET
jgi:3-oxoacyl-(acyl-carrier-protein) synthase